MCTHPFLAFAICLIALLSPALHAKEFRKYSLQEGDIVFSGSAAGQGSAIIAATGSSYTHCGLVFLHKGSLMVLEAVQPVRVSTLADFAARDSKQVFTAMRLKTAIGPDALRKAREWAAAQIGRNYDMRFAWDDQKLYCSELVWKTYQKAGVEICPLRAFRDYDLLKPEVRKVIEQRYGGMDKVPLDEKVVAPSDLAASTLLAEVPRRGD